MNSRAGYYRTNLSGETAYRSFVPAPLPPDPPVELTENMVELLIKAHCALAILESMTVRIPNAGLFKNMFMLKEALMSSQIEGIHSVLEDIFDPMSDARNPDAAAVINLVKAARFAVSHLQKNDTMQ